MDRCRWSRSLAGVGLGGGGGGGCGNGARGWAAAEIDACGEWGMKGDEAELEILNAEGGEWAAVSNGYEMFKLAW